MGCRRWIGRRSGSVGVLLVGEIEVGSRMGRTLGWNWNWTRSPGCALDVGGREGQASVGSSDLDYVRHDHACHCGGRRGRDAAEYC